MKKYFSSFLQLIAQERALFFFVLSIKILFLIGFLVLFGASRLEWADSQTYNELGINVFRGLGYGHMQIDSLRLVPDLQFPPLYPIILAFFHLYFPHGFVVLSIVQAIIAAFSTVLIYRIGKEIMTNDAAVATALLFSFEPLTALTHILMMPETFFVFLLLVSIYFFIKLIDSYSAREVFISAGSLGVALYVKPVALYLAVLFVLLLATRHLWGAAILYAVLVGVLLCPWVLRNGYMGGSYVFSTHSTNAVCGYFVFSVFATEYHTDPSNMDAALLPSSFKSTLTECHGILSGVMITAFRYPISFIKTIVLSSVAFLSNEGYAIFFQDQLNTIKRHNNYLTPTVFVMHDWQSKIVGAISAINPLQLIIILLGKLFWACIIALSFVGGLDLLRRRKITHGAVFLVVIVYFIAAAVLGVGYAAGARLRIPIHPFLFILAGCGIASLRSESRYVWQRGNVSLKALKH
ncbi:MAG: glycosyltransferase family 39 protein [Patescibacteria group bacterium]